MKEGTKSLLFGCHQFFLHPLWVLFAWRLEYKEWPKFWEIVCIFLHDVGLWGLDYLTDPYQKKAHWELGTWYGWKLFGMKGLSLIAGHTPYSDWPKSRLWKADKRSWLVAPIWWLNLNFHIENFQTEAARPRIWKKLVAEELKKKEFFSCNDLHRKNIPVQ